MSHTKGQWRTDVWDYRLATPYRKELVIQTNEIRIAVVDWDENGDNPYKVPKAEAEANAKLIAAAPEMLAMLHKLEDLPYGWDEGADPVWDELRALIVKAQGDR